MDRAHLKMICPYLVSAYLNIQQYPISLLRVVRLISTLINNGMYTFAYQRIRRIQDTGSVGSTNADVPARFLPALVSGLAFRLSQKYPESFVRSGELKQEYEFQWDLAQQEDRDRASVHFVPGGY